MKHTAITAVTCCHNCTYMQHIKASGHQKDGFQQLQFLSQGSSPGPQRKHEIQHHLREQYNLLEQVSHVWGGVQQYCSSPFSFIPFPRLGLHKTPWFRYWCKLLQPWVRWEESKVHMKAVSIRGKDGWIVTGMMSYAVGHRTHQPKRHMVSQHCRLWKVLSQLRTWAPQKVD